MECVCSTLVPFLIVHCTAMSESFLCWICINRMGKNVRRQLAQVCLASYFNPARSCSFVTSCKLFGMSQNVNNFNNSLGPVHSGEFFQHISIQLHFRNKFLTQNLCNYQSKNDFLFILSDVKNVFIKFNKINFDTFTEFI